MKISLIYMLAIVMVNVIFANTVPIETPVGLIPPATFLVGLVFVLRDFVQRRIGHYVLLVMLAGCGLSYLMASPVIATASLTAFLVAELADWLIYTILPVRFHYRVLYSSAIGVLVDSMIFLPMVGLFSWPTVAVMWASKMVAAVVVFAWYQAARA